MDASSIRRDMGTICLLQILLVDEAQLLHFQDGILIIKRGDRKRRLIHGGFALEGSEPHRAHNQWVR